MAEVIRAALVQTSWIGDKESMVKAHEEYARQAAAQGVTVMCFQELFYGPYFCQVQDPKYHAYAEPVPGPTTERFQALAAELGMVLVLPMYEQEQPGVLYNTAACVAAPAYVGDDLAHQRDQTRWFGGMVGNHVADIVSRYGSSGTVPATLTDYIRGRHGYDYSEHGRAGNTHTDFVPDEIVDRFCVLGPVSAHLSGQSPETVETSIM